MSNKKSLQEIISEIDTHMDMEKEEKIKEEKEKQKKEAIREMQEQEAQLRKEREKTIIGENSRIIHGNTVTQTTVNYRG